MLIYDASALSLEQTSSTQIFNIYFLFYSLQDNSYQVQMVKIVDDYVLHEVLGEGSYGKVYRAINQKNNKQFAIKAIETRKIKTDPIVSAGVANEIKILKRLQRCDNIVQFYQTMKSPNHMYFVYEYCNGGTLESMITKNIKLQQKTALKIFKELLKAFEVLYKHYIIHRDIKPQNILFNDGKAKIGDFGFCKNLGKNKMTRTMLGSPVYMAPQVIKEVQYSNKADIWSLGVVLFQMLYGFCPFQSSCIPKLIKVLDTTELTFPNNVQVSSQTKTLIKKMLVKDQKFRIQWTQLFGLPITNEGVFSDMSKIQNPIQISRKRTKFISKNTHIMSSARLALQDIGKKPASNLQISHNSKSQLKHKNFELSRNKRIDRSTDKSEDACSNSSKIIQKYQPIKYQNQESYERYPNKTNDNTKLQKIKEIKKQIQTGKTKLQVIDQHRSILKGLQIVRNFLKTPARHSTIFSIIVFRNIIKRLQEFKQEIYRNQNFVEVFKTVLTQLKDFNQQVNRIEEQNTFILEMIDQYEQNQRQFLSEKVPECKNWKLCYEMIGYLKRLQLQQPDESNIKILQRQVKNMLLAY